MSVRQRDGETVAVIGGGFSGAITAANLLQSSAGVCRVTLIDRDGSFGPGVAYGTTCGRHLLNVSASRMSAFEDEPDHFMRWASARRPGLTGTEFLPRAMYGEYLRRCLDGLDASRLDRIPGCAIDVEPGSGRFAVTLEGGRRVIAGAVVLALGNGPPADIPLPDAAFLSSARYVRNPWRPGCLSRIGAGDRVLLLGTGLTMLDVVLELRGAGHHATIEAVSRRGLIPTAHRAPGGAMYPPAQALAGVFWEKTTRGLLRSLRREMRVAAERGVDWREVINGLRPVTADVWGSMALAERRRFLTRVRPYWDTHRHRAAPEIAGEIDGLIGRGMLAIRAGRVVGLRDSGRGVEARIRQRGQSAETLGQFDVVINCTGPESDVRRWNDPLITSLLLRSLALVDPLGLGLETATDGRLIAADGEVVDGLMAVGALRRGSLWESTAVPELRGQAAGVARRLAGVGVRKAAG
jgi:uncharacterized NAD(P)/FAD-binding protein YdhS